MASKKDKTKKVAKAPQKKEKKGAVKKAVIKPMVHIDEFMALAVDAYGLDTMQQAGFKMFMTGKYYLSDIEAFEPYLKNYLGI